MTARRERMLRIGSWLILAFALLPAVTYMGHWSGAALSHEESHSSSVAEHEAHCHGGVSKCAGGEAMVGTVWAGEDSGLLSLTSPDLKIDTHERAAAADGEPSRILQPPRAV
jgi:hypothetical protein